MSYIPLMIDLSGRKVVIVGGGRVAERRVDALKGSEAILHVISPEISEKLISLWRQGEFIWDKRSFEGEEVLDATLVIAATNDSKVNQAVMQHTDEASLLNMTGAADQGTVIFPGTYRQGRLILSVSTEGASPMLVSRILSDFKSQYDARYEQYVDFLYVCRKHLKKTSFSKEEKNKWLSHLLSDKYLETAYQAEILEWLKTLQ
ncbi:NAD(P)-binding protein [Salinicoccus albus]|uniref:NAD(P)-binding protein n=1 Tax=Salinicoccus albus TaxID=418756 RepID=UPI000381BB1E|nr:NAD(P)-binding protein [Salinicoccus albus]